MKQASEGEDDIGVKRILSKIIQGNYSLGGSNNATMTLLTVIK